MLLNKKIPLSYLLNKIKLELLYVSIVAFIVYYLTYKFKSALPIMPLVIPTFIGTAISILLSFKLSQSYERWWEARKIWGAIVKDSRNFIMQIQTLIGKGNDKMIKKIAYRQIAMCYSLGQYTRGISATENLEALLSEKELLELNYHYNKPLALLQMHGIDILNLKENKQLDQFVQIQLDNTLLGLSDSMSSIERIKNTVFPVTYRLLLQYMIYLFVVTLSISLSDTEIYFEIPLLLLISAAFFILEKSATYMQDPFCNKPTDTPVTTIAREIELNIKQLLGEKDIPQIIPPKSFYLL